MTYGWRKYFGRQIVVIWPTGKTARCQEAIKKNKAKPTSEIAFLEAEYSLSSISISVPPIKRFALIQLSPAIVEISFRDLNLCKENLKVEASYCIIVEVFFL